MRAPLGWLATSLVVITPSMASAEDDSAGIPIRDLPPFPDVVADVDAVSEIGVFGATLAEEETVVGAAKREQSLGTVASAVTVVTADQIRRYGYRTVAEALRSVAGVYVTDDRNIERVGIRGIQPLGDANTRILILIDGTPFNEPWSQFVDSSTALPISLDDVARIEVIRGPVSSIYGTNAFIGIVNIVTLEADKAPRAHGRTTIGTNGTFGGNAGFNTGDINRQVRGSFSYEHRLGEAVTYDDLGATSSADGADALFGSVAVNFDQLFFQARAYQRTRELTGAPYESDVGSDQNTDQHRHVVAEVGYTRELTDAITLVARVYANRYDYANHLAYLQHPDPDTPDRFTTEAGSTWYGGELRALADVLPRKNLLSVTTGASLERTSTESTATTRMEPIEKSFDIAGVYLEASTEPTPWFAMTAGARFDRNSELDNATSPRAAAFFRKGEDYGVKLLYAEGFRNPSIFEAYYQDDLRFSPALDDNDTVDPSDDVSILRPERIRSYEVVAYGRLAPGLKGRVSAWDWRIEDTITRGTIEISPSNEPRIRYQNSAGGTYSRGVEIESTYRDVAGRSAYASVAYALTARVCLEEPTLIANPFLDLDQGYCRPQANAPRILAKAGASSQRIRDLFHVSAEVLYISRRVTQYEDVSVDPFVGLNTAIYVPDYRGFDISIGLRNLGAREQVPAQSDYNRTTPSSIYVLTVPGPGRELFARVGYRFR